MPRCPTSSYGCCWPGANRCDLARAREPGDPGSQLSPATHALRTWASRQELPHTWLDVDDPRGQALANAADIGVEDLPAVITPTAILRRATAGQVADHIGLALRPDDRHDRRRGGRQPAGLAAAVYGASEGLHRSCSTALRWVVSRRQRSDRELPGIPHRAHRHRADLSSTGAGVTFGAQVSSPCDVLALDRDGHLHVALSNQDVLDARAGDRHRGPLPEAPLEGWSDYKGEGHLLCRHRDEARACASARQRRRGQLRPGHSSPSAGSQVDLVVRGPELAAGMSQYLVDRVLAHASITVHTATQVTALHGGDTLGAVTLTSSAVSAEMDCRGLFCFIGAQPATEWLTGVAVDEDGFIRTDRDLTSEDLCTTWSLLGRAPLPYETSVPGVFAAGDVRSGSMKRWPAPSGRAQARSDRCTSRWRRAHDPWT